MSQAKILIETTPPVTTIIINRPQAKNALDNEAAHALAAALKAFEADADDSTAIAACSTKCSREICRG